jgi:hypothetical protein
MGFDMVGRDISLCVSQMNDICLISQDQLQLLGRREAKTNFGQGNNKVCFGYIPYVFFFLFYLLDF